MPWKRMLAYISGGVNEELLRRIECLLEEQRILRASEISRCALRVGVGPEQGA